ncbi:MAG TPA: endonuclease, partial [Acholeplasmataceae bacterium]|nr:endonuclease [Acholeplasmataceae bacterium]
YSFQIDPIKPTARLLNQPYDKLDENTQYYLIDGFIVSSNITALSVINLDYDFLYSDHNPVVLNFKLN